MVFCGAAAKTSLFIQKVFDCKWYNFRLKKERVYGTAQFVGGHRRRRRQVDGLGNMGRRLVLREGHEMAHADEGLFAGLDFSWGGF